MSTSLRRPGRFSALLANSSRSPRSRMIATRAPRRCTLTTTFWPVSRVATCTCPIVPAASGSGSIDSNTSSQGTPSSSSITETTSSSLMGVTLSWSVASSSMNSGGSRSGRVERIWPSLAKVGPSSSRARRRLRARSRSGTSPAPRSRRPYLATTRPISAARPRSLSSSRGGAGLTGRTGASSAPAPRPAASCSRSRRCAACRARRGWARCRAETPCGRSSRRCRRRPRRRSRSRRRR